MNKSKTISLESTTHVNNTQQNISLYPPLQNTFLTGGGGDVYIFRV